MAEARSFLGWVKWSLWASHMMMFGLTLVGLGGEWLLDKRPSLFVGYWHSSAVSLRLLTLLWMLWALGATPRDWSGNYSSRRTSSQEGAVLLMAIAVGLLTWQRESWLAVLLAGFPIAGIFCWWGRLRNRWLTIAIAGGILAGPAALRFPWPNEQRFALAIVFCGFAIFIDGALLLIRHLRSLQTGAPEAVSSV